MGSQKERVTKTYPCHVLATDAAKGEVEALVNVFGVVDEGDDIVHLGAFAKTLSERMPKRKIRVLNQHNTSTVLSAVGVPLEIREIDRAELERLAPDVAAENPAATGALYTKTRYLLNTPEGLGVFTRIQEGALNEYSIGFDIMDSDWTTVKAEDGTARRIRNIRAVRFWEYSSVLWGMNQHTGTLSAKETADPAERKDMPLTIGERLERCLVANATYEVGMLVGMGVIYGDEPTILLSTVIETVGMVLEALPLDLRDRVVYTPYTGTGAESTKEGRTLSNANASRLRQAASILQGVLRDAGIETDPDDTEKSATGDSAVGSGTPPTAQSTIHASLNTELERVTALMEALQS